ncbi:hypothetical protein E1301_Tti006434 [Triplophysa tibetana]|uniref:Uncharacterized protein n=1 Tax=Triplophysa tibetana TaxID=1572043 RepID=A0A5A9P1W8_9TELE|nr:hypothetical protein E1301_Tti006434 [Triplophysa tibetana]
MKLLRKSSTSCKVQKSLKRNGRDYSSQENYPTLADYGKMKKKNGRETDEFPSATVARPWKDEVTSEPSPHYTFHKSFLHAEILPNVPFDTNPPDETKIPPLSPSNTVQEWNEEYRRYCLKKQERKLKKVKIIEHPPPSTKHQAWVVTDTTRDSKVKGKCSIIKLRRKKQKKDSELKQDEIEVAVELMKPPKRQEQRKGKKGHNYC